MESQADFSNGWQRGDIRRNPSALQFVEKQILQPSRQVMSFELAKEE